MSLEGLKIIAMRWANSKTQFGSKEVADNIDLIFKNIGELLKGQDKVVLPPATPSRAVTTEILKKYDVVYVPCFGMPHYVMVIKVVGDMIYGISMSSTEAYHNIHTIQNDRYFRGKFVTNSYVSYPLKDALKSFVRVYENRKEADVFIAKLKAYYKSNLGI